ncbi:MAG: tRNA pseudouridine(38-40) synthase TruA [Desulfovibrio sp.]|jgi:tRNA pseudouridine38-40 synthase|nr:tRNA pseudouridine(38-40) synthase TruA [Desulfovibrio sp.]
MRLKLTLAYEGTAYAGWQMQAGDKKDLPTIQGKVEYAFRRLAGKRIMVQGAGRTDAGVHAEGQVCHADVEEAGTRIDWKGALNAWLPPDIRILNCVSVPADFHARASAKAKHYVYSLWMHKDRPLPRLKNFVAHCPPLDLELLATALPLLCGQHDFASFQNSGSNLAHTLRELYSIELKPGFVSGLRCPEDWPVISLLYTGNGFLKQMARNLSGLLIQIGLGKIPADAVPGILAARDRRALPSPCAPARGLTLLEVIY